MVSAEGGAGRHPGEGLGGAARVIVTDGVGGGAAAVAAATALGLPGGGEGGKI